MSLPSIEKRISLDELNLPEALSNDLYKRCIRSVEEVLVAMHQFPGAFEGYFSSYGVTYSSVNERALALLPREVVSELLSTPAREYFIGGALPSNKP